MTTTEAAKALGVSSSTVAQWCRDGRIPCQKINGRWSISVASRPEGSRSSRSESKGMTSQDQKDEPITLRGIIRDVLLLISYGSIGLLIWDIVGGPKGVRLVWAMVAALSLLIFYSIVTPDNADTKNVLSSLFAWLWLASIGFMVYSIFTHFPSMWVFWVCCVIVVLGHRTFIRGWE